MVLPFTRMRKWHGGPQWVAAMKVEKATKQAHFMAYKKEKAKGNPYFVKVGQFSKDALGDWKCDMLVFSRNEVLFSLF